MGPAGAWESGVSGHPPGSPHAHSRDAARTLEGTLFTYLLCTRIPPGSCSAQTEAVSLGTLPSTWAGSASSSGLRGAGGGVRRGAAATGAGPSTTDTCSPRCSMRASLGFILVFRAQNGAPGRLSHACDQLVGNLITGSEHAACRCGADVGRCCTVQAARGAWGDGQVIPGVRGCFHTTACPQAQGSQTVGVQTLHLPHTVREVSGKNPTSPSLLYHL